MKIALIGYGKMGQVIDEIAAERGHQVVHRLTIDNADFPPSLLVGCDAAIDFSSPEAAPINIRKCFEADVPIIVGTTGWYNDFDTIVELCRSKNQALLYGTNFSIGVNIFFEINEVLAKLMSNQKLYEVKIEETHHKEKLDSPSGTAITIGKSIITNNENYNSWVNKEDHLNDEIPIISYRKDDVKGKHSIKYSSEIDEIEIIHDAKNRKGFALGSILAAEWIQGKKGVYSMKDVLRLA